VLLLPSFRIARARRGRPIQPIYEQPRRDKNERDCSSFVNLPSRKKKRKEKAIPGMAARRSAAAGRLPRHGCERRGLPRKTASTSPSSPSLVPMSSPTRELAVLDNDGFHSGGGGRTSATNKVVKRARGQPMPVKMAHKYPHCRAPPFVALFLEGKKGAIILGWREKKTIWLLFLWR
jgi:hypothetical protein